MSDSDSESDAYDSDEVQEALEAAKASLQDGTLKCVNSEDSYRCPFSPGRKKQDYKYSEILQHAVGVGNGKRGAAIVGKHRALRDFLKTNMASKAKPQAERVVHLQQSIPSRVDIEEKRVCPWMGILQNIEIPPQNPGGSFRIGAGAAEIKEKLKAFNPESVKVLYDVRGHLGVAVIQFRNSIDGFKDAEAFQNSFYYERRGRKDFELDFPNKSGVHLYGWMATKKDIESSNKLLSEHLKLTGDLKSLPDIVKELEQKAQQQVVALKDAVDRRDDVLKETSRQNWNLSNRVDHVTTQREQAELELNKLNETHKKELEDLQRAQSAAAEEHERISRANRLETESKMLALELQIAEHEKLNMENEAEKARHCEEKDEAQNLLSLLKGQLKQQQAQESKQVELIRKHKEEKETFENELQEQRKKLQAKQGRELESQRVTEQLELEKAKKAELAQSQRMETDMDKELLGKKIAELEEQLKELAEEVEDKDSLVVTLTVSQRIVNDEVEAAKTTTLKSNVLQKHGTSEIGIKNLGELDTNGWYEICKDKFSDPGAFAEWISKLEEKLKSQTFTPFKTVPADNGGMKYMLNEEDKTIGTLRKRYGPLVARAFEAAALEIETWNSSGRYIVPMPWDFKANKRATVSQIIEHVVKVLKKLEKDLKDAQADVKQKNALLLTLQRGTTAAPSKKRGRS